MTSIDTLSRSLNTVASQYFDYEIRLTDSCLDAHQLKEFADAQMPRNGVGTVPWSTPLSSEQLTGLAADEKAEFITARMMLPSVDVPPLLGIGALIRDPDNYAHPRLIIVVDVEFRRQGLGTRITRALLGRLDPGEVAQAEVQQETVIRRGTARFFENLGFQCIDEDYRTGEIPEFVNGTQSGFAEKTFSLYEFDKN